jgi:Trp operon repressor
MYQPPQVTSTADATDSNIMHMHIRGNLIITATMVPQMTIHVSHRPEFAVVLTNEEMDKLGLKLNIKEKYLIHEVSEPDIDNGLALCEAMQWDLVDPKLRAHYEQYHQLIDDVYYTYFPEPDLPPNWRRGLLTTDGKMISEFFSGPEKREKVSASPHPIPAPGAGVGKVFHETGEGGKSLLRKISRRGKAQINSTSSIKV